MNSIFIRSSRLTTAAVLAAYTLVAGAVYFGIDRYLQRHIDAALNTKASVFAALLHRDEAMLEFEFEDDLMPEYSRKRAPEYFELCLNDGSVFRRSLSLGTDDLADLGQPIEDRSSPWDIRLPDGRHGRAVTMLVRPQLEKEGELIGESDEPPMRLTLAQGLEDLDAVRRALSIGLILGGVALSVIVVLSIRWSLARGLAPLTQLAKEVDAVTPETLDVEFSTSHDTHELAGIRWRLDELIERLGSALERERRFTSAAAHELRTPLAELKTLAQVCARWPEEHELRGRLPQDVLALAGRMQNTVESLLTFARALESSAPRELQAIDFSQVLTRLLEARPVEQRKRITASIEPALLARADATLIESVLRNLIDNAIAHAPAASGITLRARRDGEWVLFECENGRGELEQRDLTHLFEPFWRKDSSRHGDAHAGLGLALVDAWVRSWGGRISAELVADERVRFSLRLPRASD
ncbi:MAG TPA: ATP-binding protein [Planctomycetota bacterium]|nr:ATP-binding protein [Planctomycetota bacterium]